MSIIGRFTSPLRRIDTDPDDLVLEAYQLLQEIPQHRGVWQAMNALSSEATAKTLLAIYLREHRG
ncbi:hypothetical protein ACGRHY_27865 [Streptomyces sp. HK10]|uniref:hypothetical protein n=1 Tax=Streptomyces sp. HK10 TaxID=3373255 RepID=UPI00374957A4